MKTLFVAAKLPWIRNKLSFLLAVSLLLIGTGASNAQSPLDNWQVQQLGTDILTGVTYGNGTYVIVGYPYGKTWTSPDTVTWTDRSYDTSRRFLCVTFANGVFVAAGGLGAQAQSSTDAINWTNTLNSSYSNNYYGVSYLNGNFVAVGDYAHVNTSSDGFFWGANGGDNRGSGPTIYGAAYGNGVYVLTCDSGRIWSSSTAPSTGLPSPVNGPSNFRTSGTSSDLRGVAFGDSTFVAVGAAGTIITSPDGITWTTRTSGTTNTLYGIAFAEGMFATAGDGGTILTSPDGITWTSRVSGTTNLLRGIAFANDRFIAVGVDGTVTMSGAPSPAPTPTPIPPLGSLDNWQVQQLGTDILTGVTYGNGTYVIVGYTNGKTWTSPDTATWTDRTYDTSRRFLCVTFTNGVFVAAGGLGAQAQSSTDGINWLNTLNSSYSNNYYGVSYLNGNFVAVGDYSHVNTSSDGFFWGEHGGDNNGYGPPTIYGAAYGNGVYVLTCDSGRIWSSSTAPSTGLPSPVNGPSNFRTSGTSSDLRGVAYGNSTFVAVGAAGTIITSPDGITWTTRTSGTTNTLYGIAFAEGMFATAGDGGTILTSPDGITWTSRASGTINQLRGIAFANDRFIAVGVNGTVTTSPPPLPTGATPSISPNGGTYKKKVAVTMSDATSGATIYYTTDGTDPTTSSSVYPTSTGKKKKVKGISITGVGQHMVKAKAVKSGYNDSAIAVANFTIN